MEIKKILIIDGDEASRNFFRLKLRDYTISLDTAASGQEGLDKAWNDQPDLIVVDPLLPDISGMDLIQRLRQDRRTSFIKIIALGKESEQNVIDELLLGGFNEYLVKSPQGIEQLIAVISGRKQDLVEEEKGKLIIFLSAKGGTGTSSLCANIAMRVGQKEKDHQVALVDLVLPVGSIANIVGITNKTNLIDLVDKIKDETAPETIRGMLPKLTNWNFSFLSGSPDPESAIQLDVTRIPLLISALQDTFDYIFVDLGTSLSRISLPIILQANLLVLIMASDVNTILLTNTVWKYLQDKGVDPAHVYPLLNRAVGLQGLTKAEVENMLGFQVQMTIPYMGDNFTNSNNRHEPVLIRFPTDSSALVLEDISRQIIELCKAVHKLDN